MAGLCAWMSLSCYDHRVTQAIMERQRRAKAAEGAEISGGGSRALPARYTGRVRFYVSPEYRAQHADWRRRLENLIESANTVLRPAFMVELALSELHEWTPRCNPDQLSSCLTELTAIAAGEHGEWVVGVVGAQPKFTTSFEELGLAELPGSHFVLRDVSDQAEREAIDAAFASYTPGRRDEIYAKRKEHKRLALFLHEWGHTLGALHARDRESLLHPSYDDAMARFDDANATLLGASLEDVFGSKPSRGKLIASLEAVHGDDLDEQEQSELITRLKNPPPPIPQAPASAANVSSSDSPAVGEPSHAHAFVVAGTEEELLKEVAPSDRRAYQASVQALLSGDTQLAVTSLRPLVDKYPSSYAIQHLACGLFMQLQVQTDMQTTCSRAQDLAVKQSK